MPTSSPDLPHKSVADRIGRTLTVSGRSADGAFIVPLEVVGVSAPWTFNRLTTFTAEFVGPTGTRLTAPGRYLTVDGGRRFGLALSWVTLHPHAVHYRATFVHRISGKVGPFAVSQQWASRPHRGGDLWSGVTACGGTDTAPLFDSAGSPRKSS